MKLWSKIRSLWYRLRCKKPRYIYVPTKEAYKHKKIFELLDIKGFTQQDLLSTMWSFKKVKPIGTWIVDKNNFVVAEIEKKKIEIEEYQKVYDNLYPFKPRIPATSVRDTVKQSLEELKGTKNG